MYGSGDKGTDMAPGDEIYYPEGVDDEDYCVLRFTAEKGNYYHKLTKEIFSLEELEED